MQDTRHKKMPLNAKYLRYFSWIVPTLLCLVSRSLVSVWQEPFIFELMRRGLFVCVAGLLLASCSTKRLAVQVLKPAETTLPRTVQRIGVVDRSFLSGGAHTVYENGYISTRFGDVPRIGGQKTVEGFFVEMGAFNRFNTRLLTTSEKRDSLLKTVPKAADALLQKWATDSSLDALVSLEGYEVRINTDANVYTSIYYDAFGVPYTVPRFQGRRSIKVVTFWRIYNLKNNAVLTERTLETELVFSSNGYSPDDSYRNLPERIGSVENTSQVAGIKYAKTLIPYWQSTERMVYVGQTNAWLDAADSADVGNWESAAEQWRKLMDKSPFPIVKRQAVFNLFTAYEVMGNFDEAERWAKLGQRKYKHRDFDAGLLFLDKRRIENSQLDEQLNE